MSKTYKVLHTADTHLRQRQFNHLSRGEDFTKAFHAVIDVAIEHKVCAIVQAGDFIDTSTPSSHIIKKVIPAIQTRLVAAGIPMFMVNGDHDKTDPPWTSDLGRGCDNGIHMMENQIATIPNTPLTIYGLDFIGKTKERFLEIRDALPSATILLWHTMVKEFAGFYGEESVSLAELPAHKYSLIALGDIHKCDYKDVGPCMVGYPGSTELVKKDEPLEKTVSIFEFDEQGHILGMELVVIPTRPVRLFRIANDADVVRVLTDIEKIKDLDPIIIGRYDSNIPDVVKRIYAAVDPDKAIIRLAPMQEMDAPLEADKQSEEEKGLIDFLPEFHQPGSELFDVAAAMLRPEAPIADIVNGFVDKHMTPTPLTDAVTAPALPPPPASPKPADAIPF